MTYLDRRQAGEVLARHLTRYTNRHSGHLGGPDNENVIVMALPRGGVPVAYEVARYLNAPMDIVVARKLGAPHNPELGIGAISLEGATVLNDSLIDLLQIPRDYLRKVIEKEQKEMNRRLAMYRGDLPMPNLKGKTVILVDDGLATGVTAMAAIRAIRKARPKRLILAVPVCSDDAVKTLQLCVDELVCPDNPVDFHAVGEWYQNFDQTTDEEVIDYLIRNQEETPLEYQDFESTGDWSRGAP